MSAVECAESSAIPTTPFELNLGQPSVSKPVTAVILGVLLAIALLCRMGGLAGAVTEDEDQWMARAGNFASGLLNGDRGRTYQTGHPGVIPMWLITGSLGLERTAELSSRGRPDFVVTALPQFLPDLRQSRVPFLVLGGLLCAAASALAWRLLGAGPGLIAAALLVTDPYWSAMSPVVGMDGLLAGFLSISLIALLLALSEPRRAPIWIVCSGIGIGLAGLTKTSAAYMLPALAAVVLAASYGRLGRLPLPLGEGWGEGLEKAVSESASTSPQPSPFRRWTLPVDVDGRRMRRSLLLIAVWLLAGGVIYYALWPAMWTQPIGTLYRAIDFSARLGGTPHAPGNFLLGSTAEDPGPLFYPVAMAFRLGPSTTLGLLALIAFGASRRLTKVSWLLLIAAGVFTLLLTVSPKKVDRYLMPVAPLLTILAAIGWWRALEWLVGRQWTLWSSRVRMGSIIAGIALLGGAFQVWPLIQAGRYPLAAYNPLFGGARAAERAIPVGWGEGLDDTAAIIQNMAAGGPLTTSIWFPLRVNFQAHMPGRVVTERQLSQADFFVDYIHARQRLHTPSQLQRRAPDAVVSIGGVDYARIYRLR